MARKSNLEKQVQTILVNMDRPNPPYTLTDAEAAIWEQIWLNIQPDWIGAESYELLVNYIRHLANANYYAQILNEAKAVKPSLNDVDLIKNMDRLSKMLERETRSASSLATRLRLTNQSLRSDKSAKPTLVKKPWED